MTANKKAFEHARKALALIPDDEPAAVIMRHAERPDITPGESGNDLPLTEQGKQDALDMGKLMEGRIAGLLHSPIPRCMETADYMKQGGNARVSLKKCEELKCGAYTRDSDEARETFDYVFDPDIDIPEDEKNKRYDAFIKKMATAGNEIPYKGFEPPLLAAGELVRVICPNVEGLQIGITHDWLVNVTASYASGKRVKRVEHPGYAGFLDALFVWQTDKCYMFYYKGETGPCPPLFQDAVNGRRNKHCG